jgi:NAD(P)-dependent dehydrogenase (short-subunit alcohol dehydrogenase family)
MRDTMVHTTGANSGIGKAVALARAVMGADLVALAFGRGGPSREAPAGPSWA